MLYLDKYFDHDIDQKKTQIKAKKYLESYRFWRMKYPRVYNNNEITKAQMECKSRIDTLKNMNQEYPFLADLLNFRYIKQYTVTKTARELAEKYDGYFSDRSYYRYHNEALLMFALMCSNEYLLVRRTR